MQNDLLLLTETSHEIVALFVEPFCSRIISKVLLVVLKVFFETVNNIDNI